MSDDPLINQLSKLTPDGAGLDRDALLFAAGKASARPNRRWMALAGALVASQVAVLGLILSRAPEQGVLPGDARQISISAFNTQWLKPLPQSESPKPDTASYLALRDRFLREDGLLPPVEPIDSALPDEPPLRAFGSLSPDLFN